MNSRQTGSNVSSLTQEALRSALVGRRSDRWLEQSWTMRPVGIDHDAVLGVTAAAKSGLKGDG